MAAIYGNMNFWKNTTKTDHTLMIERLLQNDFSTMTLITGVTIALLGPIAALANGIVIAAFLKDPYKNLRSTPSNIIIASMATCDFLAGTVGSAMVAFLFISLSSKVQTSLSLVQISLALFTLLVNLSVYHDLALSVDRAMAVANPLLYKSRITSTRTLILVILIWLFHLALALLQIPLSHHFYIYDVILVVKLFIGVGIACFLSLFIIHCVRKQTKELRKETGKHKTLLARQRKLTKSIVFICLVLRICFTPFFISWSLLSTCSPCHANLTALMTSYLLSIILMYLNFCINPFLYAFRLPKFQKPVTFILKSFLLCCPSSS